MQFSLSLVAFAATALASVSTVTSDVSSTVTPSAKVVSVYTDATGKEATTTIGEEKLTEALSAYKKQTTDGSVEIVKTIGPKHPQTTVTTTTGTHRYGRFDKTEQGTATAVVKDTKTANAGNVANSVNAFGFGAAVVAGALLAC